MMPVIFRIPLINWYVPGYGLALTLGFLLSVVWAVRRAVKSGANPDVVLNCAFIALVGGVVGSRIMYVAHFWDQFSYRGNWLSILMAILDVRQGGLVVYGGFLAAMVGILIYLGFWRHSIRWYLDILAPSTALGMGLGRIGCFLNGCCWGAPSDLPWAVRFPFGSNAAIQQWHDGVPGAELPKELIYLPPGGIGVDGQAAEPLPRELLWVRAADVEKVGELYTRHARAKTDAERAAIERQYARIGCCLPNAANLTSIYLAMKTHGLSLEELRRLARQFPSQPVHPVQLYSTVALVLLAMLLNAAYWRRTRDGQIACTLLMVEPWSRFVLEFIRVDEAPVLGPLTWSQVLALPISVVGLMGLLALRWLPPRSPRARLWEPSPPAGKPPRLARAPT